MRLIGTIISVILISYLIIIAIINFNKDNEAIDFSEYEDGSISEREVELPTQDLAEREFGLEVGQNAPNFQLNNIKGEVVNLSDFKGKVVLLNFWATWCPPCVEEMPEMQDFYDDRNADKIEILAINATNFERSSTMPIDFVKQHQLTFPILLDSEGDVVELYKVRFFPTTYILDEDGVIREIISYPLEKESIEEFINKF